MKVINDDDFDDDDDDERKNAKKRSLSQMIDQVMTINSVQKSSKSELSSWGKRPFKVILMHCCAALSQELNFQPSHYKCVSA